MNTRDIAVEYRLTHWAGIMRERRESGLSIKAYCQNAGFHENVYYYWQRKLREEACAALSAKESELETRLAPIGWSRLAATSAIEGIAIEINGCRVNATTSTDPELLAQVCRVLKAL